MVRLAVSGLILLVTVSGSLAVTVDHTSATGILASTQLNNSIYVLCESGLIIYGSAPSTHDGVRGGGAWDSYMDPVPVPVASILEFYGESFLADDGRVWVWSRHETTTWRDPNGMMPDVVETTYEWDAMDPIPCWTGVVDTKGSSLGGIKGLFR